MSDLSSQHDKASEMMMASSASVANSLEMFDQAIEKHQMRLTQAMSSIDNEMSSVKGVLQTLDQNRKTQNLSMEKVWTAVTDQNLLLATQLRDFIRVHSADNQKVLIGEIKDMFVTELVARAHHFVDHDRDSIKTDDYQSQPNAKTQSTAFGHTSFPKCLCMRGRVITRKRYGLFQVKTDRHDNRVCPVHRGMAQHTYSIETKLSPWFNGALEVTLSVLRVNISWSILPSLTFHGTVKRSESPIYQLFDHLLAAYHRGIPLGEEALWKSSDVRERLSDLICGIKRAVASGSASYSDVDEYGNNLLTVSRPLIRVPSAY